MGTQLPQKGGTATPNFRPCLLGPNDWMDEGGTWYGGRPQPRQYCVRSGPSPPEKMSTAAPPLFGPYHCGWMDQDGTWYGDRPQPRPHCARWRPSSPTERGTPAPTQFLAHVYCGQTAGWIKMALGTAINVGPGDVVLDGVAAPPKRGTAPSFRSISIVAKRLDG